MGGDRDRDRDRGQERGDRDRDRARDRDRERRRSRSRSGERRDRSRERSRRDSRSPRRDGRADDRHKRDDAQDRYRDDRRGPPSHPARMSDHRPPPPLRPALNDGPPAVGSIHKGAVHTIRPFGVFIAIEGHRKHVLVHHSQLSDDIRFAKDDLDEDKVRAQEFFFPKGTQVWVKVVEVTPDERSGDMRVNGSLRVVDQSSGADLDPGNAQTGHGRGGGPQSDLPPEVGSVHRATVKRIEPYGVFMALEGYRKYGLVHSSQVSNYINFSKEDTDEDKKAELGGVVHIGDSMWVKVCEVIEDDGTGRGPKIQCSIKLVDQKSGEDLDPTFLRYKPRGQAEGHGGGPRALGADAGQVVGGKVDWGHLAGADSKLYVGDFKGQYKLLDDDRPRLPGPPPMPHGGLPPPPPQGLPPPPPPPAHITSVEEALAILEQAGKKHKKDKKGKKDKKEKKSKKEKKDKKDKKDKRKASSSSSSD